MRKVKKLLRLQNMVKSIRKVSLSEENRTAFGKQKAVLKVILSDCTNVAGGWRKKHYGDSIFSDL